MGFHFRRRKGKNVAAGKKITLLALIMLIIFFIAKKVHEEVFVDEGDE